MINRFYSVFFSQVYLPILPKNVVRIYTQLGGANINYTFQFTLPLPPRRRQKNLLQAMLSIEWGVRSTPSQTRRN